MPKVMILDKQKYQSNETNKLNLVSSQKSTVKGKIVDEEALINILRKKRSKEYMSCFLMLDNGGQVNSKELANKIMEKYLEEFPTVTAAPIYLSKCYLGGNYEVHTMDVFDEIIHHYKNGEPLPKGGNKVKGLLISGQYEVAELYDNFCIMLDHSGGTSVIRY